MVEEGDVVHGAYRVEGILATTRIGTLVSAADLERGREVTLELIAPELLRSPSAVRRLVSEARAAGRLRSPQVAHVVEVVEPPEAAPYLVLEPLRGMDLGALLRRRGQLAYREVIDHVLQACAALAEAHAAGLVHRALEPASLFRGMRPEGELAVKVLGFGAWHLGPWTFGPRPYVSPEQLRGARDVDARTDVWALGAIAYELLAGAPPFRGTTYAEVRERIEQAPVPSLLDVRPDVPTGVWEVLVRCLAKDRPLRIQSVHELASALRHFAPTQVLHAVETPAPPTVTDGSPPALDGAAPSLGPPARSSAAPLQRATGRASLRRRLPLAIALPFATGALLGALWAGRAPSSGQVAQLPAPQAAQRVGLPAAPPEAPAIFEPPASTPWAAPAPLEPRASPPSAIPARLDPRAGTAPPGPALSADAQGPARRTADAPEKHAATAAFGGML